mmetsp:Transcript_2224/g.4073  ORF Transcript_2224/g.4073 Transcript_2224/m.4073 type:complete len:83 (+) Transcript_2224:56-304(+)
MLVCSCFYHKTFSGSNTIQGMMILAFFGPPSISTVAAAATQNFGTSRSNLPAAHPSTMNRWSSSIGSKVMSFTKLIKTTFSS